MASIDSVTRMSYASRSPSRALRTSSDLCTDPSPRCQPPGWAVGRRIGGIRVRLVQRLGLGLRRRRGRIGAGLRGALRANLGICAERSSTADGGRHDLGGSDLVRQAGRSIEAAGQVGPMRGLLHDLDRGDHRVSLGNVRRRRLFGGARRVEESAAWGVRDVRGPDLPGTQACPVVAPARIRPRSAGSRWSTDSCRGPRGPKPRVGYPEDRRR